MAATSLPDIYFYSLGLALRQLSLRFFMSWRLSVVSSFRLDLRRWPHSVQSSQFCRHIGGLRFSLPGGSPAGSRIVPRSLVMDSELHSGRRIACLSVYASNSEMVSKAVAKYFARRLEEAGFDLDPTDPYLNKIFGKPIRLTEEEPGGKMGLCTPSPWPKYSSSYDDEDPFIDWEDLIQDCICNDDKDYFIGITRTPSFDDSPETVFAILKLICETNSVNCATALVERETPLRVGLNKPDSEGFFPLHYAAFCLSPDVADLFICHGAQSDAICRVGMSSLGLALVAIRLNDLLNDWTGKSVYMLIVKLCHPKLRNGMNTVKLLARSTKEIEKVACLYANGVNLIEFATLLMVAREKVLGSVTCNSSSRLCKFINNEIALMYAKEFKLTGKVRTQKLTQEEEKKLMGLKQMQKLLKIFEKAGNAIEEYWQQPYREEKEVAKDVAWMFVEANFDLDPEDSDLSDIFGKSTSLLGEESGGKWFVMPSLDRSLCPKVLHSVPPIVSPLVFSHTPFIRRPVHSSFILEARYRSSYSGNLDSQLMKRTNAIERGVRKVVSREKLAFFALAIKRALTQV